MGGVAQPQYGADRGRHIRLRRANPRGQPGEKILFSRLEKREYKTSASEATFGKYAAQYIEKVLPTLASETTREDYECALRSRLVPYFGEMIFGEITNDEVGKFISAMPRPVVQPESGEPSLQKPSKPLSAKTVRNLLIPFRVVWKSACAKFRWSLPDPFHKLKRFFSKKAKSGRRKTQGGWQPGSAVCLALRRCNVHY
jgi:integrase